MPHSLIYNLSCFIEKYQNENDRQLLVNTYHSHSHNINMLKFEQFKSKSVSKMLTEWQTVQTLNRLLLRSSLIRVCTVCCGISAPISRCIAIILFFYWNRARKYEDLYYTYFINQIYHYLPNFGETFQQCDYWYLKCNQYWQLKRYYFL